MGITLASLTWMERHLGHNGVAFPGQFRMLELGNQTLHINGRQRPAKHYFVENDVDHVSVDLNGLDGALPMDLCQPLDLCGLDETFDVATDFGTSEHVADLWQCLKNIHTNTGPGALIFHVNPAPGNWPGHGFWYRAPIFYAAFAMAAGYEILSVDTAPACGNTKDGWETRCAMVRGTAPFPSREAFALLPLETK